MRHNHAASGEVIVYPAFSEHWIRWQAEAEFLLLFLDPAYMTQSIGELTRHNTVELAESQQEGSDPLLQQIALALKNEMEEGTDPISSLYVESLTGALSAHLLRRYAVWKPGRIDALNLRARPDLQRILDYIQDNLDQHLTLAELAFISNMSTYHFARTFKQFTGVAPHQYILNARIERAKSLLTRGGYSLSEIAGKVGFFDQSHFTRVFKRIPSSN